MKNLFIYPILLIVVFIFSCTDDDSIESNINPKSVTDCELSETIDVGICVAGTDVASPNETIIFVSKFYSGSENVPSNSQISWEIEYGNMEIINIENSIDGLSAKSLVTIKFNSDFSGGRIWAKAENNGDAAGATQTIDLEQK